VTDLPADSGEGSGAHRTQRLQQLGNQRFEILDPIAVSGQQDHRERQVGKVLLKLEAAISREEGLEARTGGFGKEFTILHSQPIHLADGRNRVTDD